MRVSYVDIWLSNMAWPDSVSKWQATTC